MRSICFSKLMASVAVAPLSVIVATSALAQETTSASNGAVAQEIVVTAQRRAQSINDVGIAVTAVSGDVLSLAGLTDVRDIASLVPSFKVVDFAPTTAIFNIRGVSQNDFGDQLEAPIAVFRDDAYVGAMGAIAGELFDIKRVEVERGPQGTLFGRNATGGVVQYISNAPTDDLEGYLQAGGGSDSEYRVEGALSGPLANGIQGRIAGVYLNHDGWMKNTLGRDLMAADELELRGRLRFAPVDNFIGDLIGYYTRDFNTAIGGYTHTSTYPNADGLGVDTPANFSPTFEPVPGFPVTVCAGCDLAGYKRPYDTPYKVDVGQPFNFNREYYGGTFKAEYHAGNVTLTSITDAFRLSKHYNEDSDSGPTDLFNYDTDQHYKQISQEGRVTADLGPAILTGGVYYLNMSQRDVAFVGGDYLSSIVAGDIGVPFSGTSLAHFTLDTDSIAGFGHVEYKLPGSVTLIGGFRYTHDVRQLNYLFDDGFGGETIFNANQATSTSFPPSVANPALAKRSFDGISDKAEVDWKPTSDILTYVSYSRGWKSGNYEAPVFPADIAALPHNPEKLDAYEVGAKISLANHRIQLNTAAFYYDYKSYQAFALVDAAQVIFNTNAQLYGAEFELQAELAPHLHLTSNLSLLDSKVFNVPLASGRIVNSELPQAAPISGSEVLRYDVPVGPGTITVQGEIAFSGPFNFSVLPAPALREHSYTTGNLSLAYTSDDNKWRVVGAVTNLWDERYRTSSIDTSFIGVGQDTFARPRWYTITLTRRI